ncbi:alpha/beta fold hydrolase [Thalassotalea aquiviva]|uniref:alpha/beta fold hydrolase n=1 Tax=Thalassotalea aquiviva TaxID=3242415 RepID=UPI00352A0653
MRELTYHLGSTTICGLAIGDERKPVVLCLHGWLDNAASFIPLFEQIKATTSLLEQYQFIAIDWPGHGLSSHRSVDAHYHFVDWCWDLLQLLESQHWQQVSLIGHSMGGMVASLFTSAFNDRVNKLVLIESIGLITLTESPSELLRQGLQSRLKSGQKQLRVHTSVESAVRARMNVSDLPNHCAQLIVERGLQSVKQGYCWRSDPRLKELSPQRYPLKQAVQVMTNIHRPVHLIFGDNGFDMVQAGIKLFSPLISDFQQTRVTGGHHPQMENPVACTDIIARFLLT